METNSVKKNFFLSVCGIKCIFVVVVLTLAKHLCVYFFLIW